MRGEDHTVEQYPRPKQGSPPHARGRRLPRIRVDEILGITPACAGKTNYANKRITVDGDHPRMRGEDDN